MTSHSRGRWRLQYSLYVTLSTKGFIRTITAKLRTTKAGKHSIISQYSYKIWLCFYACLDKSTPEEYALS